jgi:phospholipid-binding lipoprotein MlaA
MRGVALAAMLMVAACATPPVDDPIAMAEYEAANDPFEPINRQMFEVNLFLDRILLKPAAQAYVWLFPVELRDAVHNIITNADEPVNFANSVLQGDAARAGTALGRLAINTTLGIGGMIDVASDLGLEPVEEDFGQTLAVWGLESGPYLVLPLFGPATVRDGFGRVGDFFFDPLTYVLWNTDKEYIGPSILATTALDLRSRNLNTLDEIERTSIDFYATIRSLYQQRREDLINNGITPADEDPFISDPFDY